MTAFSEGRDQHDEIVAHQQKNAFFHTNFNFIITTQQASKNRDDHQ